MIPNNMRIIAICPFETLNADRSTCSAWACCLVSSKLTITISRVVKKNTQPILKKIGISNRPLEFQYEVYNQVLGPIQVEEKLTNRTDSISPASIPATAADEVVRFLKKPSRNTGKIAGEI